MKHLFIIDPVEQINPSKDSSAAIMQAAKRASIDVWFCNPSDLQARGDKAWAAASQVDPDPWISINLKESIPLTDFSCIWMRKDPPVNEAYLYATHLLEVAERNGVLIVNKPASLRAWNEKLGALRFYKLMAPTLVASRVLELNNFVNTHDDVVLKPLGGKGGQGVIRIKKNAPSLKALLELVTEQEHLPIMMQKYLPEVEYGDKRIILVNGEPVGAVNRKPKLGDFRSNLALGGEPEATNLSKAEIEICAKLSPELKEQGLFFVGIDVIGGMLSEINVTSPTGLREIENLMSVKVADQVIEKLLNALG